MKPSCLSVQGSLAFGAAGLPRQGRKGLTRISCQICRPDQEIIDATMKELERLFPNEIRADQSMAKVGNWADLDAKAVGSAWRMLLSPASDAPTMLKLATAEPVKSPWRMLIILTGHSSL